MYQSKLGIEIKHKYKPPRKGALPREFYTRDTIEVAINLLGKILVHDTPQGLCSGKIVETEAYLGENDLACHASSGITKRTKIFWGPPGKSYVFVNYGVYFCLNAITMSMGTAGCVLIRAVEPLEGIDLMRLRRTNIKKNENLMNGPGKLTRAFGITKENNGEDLTYSSLYIMKNSEKTKKISVSKRIGITKHADAFLRFFVDENPFVSGTKKQNNESISLEKFIEGKKKYLSGINDENPMVFI